VFLQRVCFKVVYQLVLRLGCFKICYCRCKHDLQKSKTSFYYRNFMISKAAGRWYIGSDEEWNVFESARRIDDSSVCNDFRYGFFHTFGVVQWSLHVPEEQNIRVRIPPGWNVQRENIGMLHFLNIYLPNIDCFMILRMRNKGFDHQKYRK
jgi:hypothetical protein